MGAIGVFDSGYGGLTIFRALQEVLPQYDFVYLGDNARAPYGSHSFDTIYRYTREAVDYLFNEAGCPLVILACNTASAKALRTIQQQDLPVSSDPTRRVLGVIRPSVESIERYSSNGHIGVIGTIGTVTSRSYVLEMEHLYPSAVVTQQACPMWAPLVENNEVGATPGTRYFVQRDLDRLLEQDPHIDTLLLGCTHYPLLLPRITEALPPHIHVISQGGIVADSLLDYLKRHPEMEARLTRSAAPKVRFLTTAGSDEFLTLAGTFLGRDLRPDQVERVQLTTIDRLR